jgi:hypothetical protein
MPNIMVSAVAGIVAIVALILGGVALASDDKGPDNTAQVEDLQASIDTLNSTLEETQASLERAQLIGALNTLDAAGFHAIDDELQAATEIPAGTAGSITTARQIAGSIAWPEELSEKSDLLLAKMDEFLAALEAEDLQASKGLATETHDAWHDLEHDAYPFVAGEEHEEGNGHEEGEGEDTEGEHAE